MIANCLTIPVLAFTLMKVYGMPMPSFNTVLFLGLGMAIAQFSVAGVPAGGIMIHIPLIVAHLGFSGEMIELLIAVYVLFDCTITCGNIFGNSAFVILFNKLLKKLNLGS